MTTNRPGMTGMATPHPQDEPSSEVQSLPDEEHIDQGRLEEDLEKAPEEKRNATDGYAPADEGVEPKTVEDDLERFDD